MLRVVINVIQCITMYTMFYTTTSIMYYNVYNVHGITTNNVIQCISTNTNTMLVLQCITMYYNVNGKPRTMYTMYYNVKQKIFKGVELKIRR